MEAKEYLEQLKALNILIDSRKLQLEELKYLAVSISANSGYEKVQTSKQSDKVGNTVVRIVDLQNEINEKICSYINIKDAIINQIESLEVLDHIRVLNMRYVLFYTYEKISSEMNICTRHIYRIHGEALKEFQQIINKIPKSLNVTFKV